VAWIFRITGLRLIVTNVFGSEIPVLWGSKFALPQSTTSQPVIKHKPTGETGVIGTASITKCMRRSPSAVKLSWLLKCLFTTIFSQTTLTSKVGQADLVLV